MGCCGGGSGHNNMTNRKSDNVIGNDHNHNHNDVNRSNSGSIIIYIIGAVILSGLLLNFLK